MKRSVHTTVVVAAFGALAWAGAWAQPPSPLPPVQQQGDVAYLSGGIGLEESTAIKEASPQWPLTLVFAVRSGTGSDYASNVHVVIRDAKGHPALETTAGPYLLARLAPGRYRVRATLADVTLHAAVSVQAGHPTKTVLVWPAGTGAS